VLLLFILQFEIELRYWFIHVWNTISETQCCSLVRLQVVKISLFKQLALACWKLTIFEFQWTLCTRFWLKQCNWCNYSGKFIEKAIAAVESKRAPDVSEAADSKLWNYWWKLISETTFLVPQHLLVHHLALCIWCILIEWGTCCKIWIGCKIQE